MPNIYYEQLTDLIDLYDLAGVPQIAHDTLTLNDDLLVVIESYIPILGSISGADRYFSSVLHGQLWEVTSGDRKQKALVSATNAINLLRFAGEKNSPNQPLEWPRNHQQTIPLGVQQATYEEALALLQGIDPATEASNLYVKSRVFGRLQRVQTDYDFSLHAPEHVVAGIASYRAWQLLKPYLSRATGVRLRRRS